MDTSRRNRKIALVTGANRGIGFEICNQLAQIDSLTVLLTARDPSKGEAAAKQLTDKGLDVLFYQLDVSDKNHVKRISSYIELQFGQLDILVNNAAILFDTWQSAINADLDVVNKAITTNLYGPWLLCQAFIPIMKKNGYGRIVNVSSGEGSLHYMKEGGSGGGRPAYSISKVALNALTIKLASDLIGTGILVNSVNPGWVATDMGGHGGRSIVDGAKGIVWAATLADDGPSGGFFCDGDPELW